MIIEIALGVLLGGVLFFTIDKWLPLVLGAGALVIGLGIVAAILVGIYMAGDYFFSSPNHWEELGSFILVIGGIWGPIYLLGRCLDHPNWKIIAIPGTLGWMVIPSIMVAVVVDTKGEGTLTGYLVIGSITLVYFSLYGLWLKRLHRRSDKPLDLSLEDETQ